MRYINNERDGASKLIEQEMKYPECPWNARVVTLWGWKMIRERFKLERGRLGEWFVFATRIGSFAIPRDFHNGSYPGRLLE